LATGEQLDRRHQVEPVVRETGSGHRANRWGERSPSRGLSSTIGRYGKEHVRSVPLAGLKSRRLSQARVSAS
jgi:hypothetical protein